MLVARSALASAAARSAVAPLGRAQPQHLGHHRHQLLQPPRLVQHRAELRLERQLVQRRHELGQAALDVPVIEEGRVGEAGADDVLVAVAHDVEVGVVAVADGDEVGSSFSPL
jgi:hypothetical protein